MYSNRTSRFRFGIASTIRAASTSAGSAAARRPSRRSMVAGSPSHAARSVARGTVRAASRNANATTTTSSSGPMTGRNSGIPFDHEVVGDAGCHVGGASELPGSEAPYTFVVETTRSGEGTLDLGPVGHDRVEVVPVGLRQRVGDAANVGVIGEVRSRRRPDRTGSWTPGSGTARALGVRPRSAGRCRRPATSRRCGPARRRAHRGCAADR